VRTEPFRNRPGAPRNRGFAKWAAQFVKRPGRTVHAAQAGLYGHRMGGLRSSLGDARIWARDFALATSLGLFLAPIGPFGSYSEPIARRLAECLAYAWSGTLVWSPGLRIILWLTAATRINDNLARVGGALVLCPPIAVMVHLVSLAFSGGATRLGWFSATPQIAMIAVPLAAVSCLVRFWTTRQQAVPAAPSPARLLARLPAAVGEELLALEAEDHYVRVHTARGSALLLMRFADAIAELDGRPGLQVHRSWWVARTAVTGAVKAGRRASLVLVGGLIVPVSRAAMPQARAQGLLGVRASGAARF